MLFKMMAVAAGMVVAVPVMAQTADPATTTPAPKPQKEKKVCRTQPPITGSRMSVSTCHTPSQWAKIDAAGGEKNSTPGVRSYSGENAGNQ